MTHEPLPHTSSQTKPPLTPQALLAQLEAWEIGFVHHAHPAVFTVAESAALKAAIPGAHTKNLFLKDKGGALFLFSAAADAVIDLPGLGRALQAKGRLSFASAELLWERLGVRPGSVTAFALANDREQRVRFLLDAALLHAAHVHFHPLHNEATIGVTPAGLLRFLERLGRAPALVALARDCAPRLIGAAAD
ncbi:MAG: prolyl-tRNA synthetase associated domain-containing protein [Hyphomonadaceae bacterium]|nr:prolyl-tRNA synthetase associated domain-containing protein [Hyphomonadaceae bacterium]